MSADIRSHRAHRGGLKCRLRCRIGVPRVERLLRPSRSRARSARVGCRLPRELPGLRRLSCQRSLWARRDRSKRYAGCDAPFRGGPTSMRYQAVRHDLTYPTPRANRKTTRSRMMRRISLALLMVMFCAASLSAQRRRTVYSTDPEYWITAGVAGFRANGVNDGVTSSSWDFGNSTNFQYRASLEKGWTNGASFGVAGSWAHVPFLYSSTGILPPAAGGGTQCASC